MKADEVRKKYIEFFVKKGHSKIDPSPLVLENDLTTLFTSAGMQQLVPNLLGEKHPKGKRLVNSQPCIRTQDIDEVGDNRHTTFFEMLGNWSLGDYFKEEQLSWVWEFFTKELSLPKEKLWVTVFEGTKEVSRDSESAKIWKKLGVPDERIHFYGADKNWWSMSGPPEKMQSGQIGGPDSEVFFEFTKVEHDKKYGDKCHPNCDCGRFLEIGNSVFMQYLKKEDGTLEELEQKSVDFGGGLERIVAACQDTPDVFRTDVFSSLIKEIEKLTNKKYGENSSFDSDARIISDHYRAAISLITEGMLPSNKMQGYVLRRLIRRSALKIYLLTGSINKTDLNLKGSNSVIEEELERFKNSLQKGISRIEKIEKIDGKNAFDLYQSYGFPLEVTKEIFEKKGQVIEKDSFEMEFEKHKELSRTASSGTFKGGLADKSEETVKLHTATHLLHWALRKELGEVVKQEGSNITGKRLRFDFSFDRKLTEKEVGKLEELINEKIKEALPVVKTIEDKKKALKSGALSFFREKYPDKVSVYTIGREGDWISKEFCGGPHVGNTSEIGRVRISKQKKIGSNLIRVYAELI